MTQAPSYESNEFSEALLAVDGQLVSSSSGGFLVRITGNGGPLITTGWVNVVRDLPSTVAQNFSPPAFTPHGNV